MILGETINAGLSADEHFSGVAFEAQIKFPRRVGVLNVERSKDGLNFIDELSP